MSQCVVISGQLNSEGRLELNEQIPLPPGPVRVSIEPLPTPSAPTASPLLLSDEEWEERRRVLASCIGCLTDEEAEAIIRTVEEEFEQVNLDDWR
jgi:hypothetical protein